MLSALNKLQFNNSVHKVIIRQRQFKEFNSYSFFPQGKQRDYSTIHSGESVIAKHKNGRYANLIDKFVYHKAPPDMSPQTGNKKPSIESPL